MTGNYDPSDLPMLLCPRFQSCSAPVCPLDPERDVRTGPFTDAHEPSCALSRSKRLELGRDLPWRGLWPRELAATVRYEQMSVEDRRQLAARGRKALELVGAGA